MIISSTSRAKDLSIVGLSVKISSFLPPANCRDDPTQDGDFLKLLADVRATKNPPTPIREIRCSDGIRLADREAYKLWLACRGGRLDGTGGLGMLHKKSVKVVKPGAGDRDRQDDGPGNMHQVEDEAIVPVSRSPIVGEHAWQLRWPQA